MEQKKLARFCELKAQHKKIEDELESLRKEIIAAYSADAQFELEGCTLKLVYQDKRQYDDVRLFEAVPDPELWKALFKADSVKIGALLKANLLSEKALEGTYRVVRTPYLYVHSQP
ncbi:hypothetical protein ACFPPD_22155 [Cohnella suwonensis]|uniref:Uncharacterized protein n=1 Tax=Cohnella suwonensis TaxID=696072 RepID=A0ABW0M351_9BACL